MSRRKSPLNHFFESESAAEGMAFLRSRGEKAHIVAPDWLKQRVVGKPAVQRTVAVASWSQDLPDRASLPGNKLNFIIVADDAEVEERMLGSLRSFEASRSFGFFRDVVPALLCGVNGMASGRPTGNLKKYALLCIPRSGSRYLSAVLKNRGVGAPKEHLREPLANIISEGKLGFQGAMLALERFGQHNEIFGTKLISTFLISASQRCLSKLELNVGWMIDRGYRIVHLQRDLNESVVSSYIAFQMRKWHFFGELDEGSRAKLDNLVFERGAALDEYIRFRSEQIVLDHLVSLHDIPSVSYSEIQGHVESVLARLCALVDVDLEKLEGGYARMPVPTHSESPTYARFAQSLQDVLRERAEEIDERTIRKIRAVSSLDRAGAEKLVDKSRSTLT